MPTLEHTLGARDPIGWLQARLFKVRAGGFPPQGHPEEKEKRIGETEGVEDGDHELPRLGKVWFVIGDDLHRGSAAERDTIGKASVQSEKT